MTTNREQGRQPKAMYHDDSKAGERRVDVQPADSQAVQSWFALRTLIGFLIGNRRAILAAAHCTATPWLGAVLVLSAALAREYDGEDLGSEPWHLLIPFAASITTSFVLYVLLCLPSALWQKCLREFCSEYPRFLGLFWLTAPLAWLYAVPVERFLSAAQATRCNLWMLGIVSVWRVALMIRIVTVVYRIRVGSAIVTVLLFGDSVMLFALNWFPVPVLRMMGGMRLTAGEAMLQATRFMLFFMGGLAVILLLPLYFGTLAKSSCCRVLPFPVPKIDVRLYRRVWGVAVMAVVIWAPILPHTQPPQQRRFKVERAIRSGDYASALQYLSQHEPADFPPHWTPPPQVAFPNQPCDISDVMLVLVDQESVAPWVRKIYVAKFQRACTDKIHFRFDVSNPQNRAFLQVLGKLPVSDWQDLRIQGQSIRTILQQSSDYKQHADEATLQLIQRLIERLE